MIRHHSNAIQAGTAMNVIQAGTAMNAIQAMYRNECYSGCVPQ